MKEKIRDHFFKFNVSTFIIITIFSLLAMDVLSFIYLLKTFEVTLNPSNPLIQKLLSSQLQISAGEIDPYFLKEFSALMLKTLYLAIFFILCNNTFFYTFFYKRRKWAHSFVSSYCFFGALLNGMMFLDPNKMGVIWNIVNFLMIPAYLYFYLGVKTLKDQIILVPEKTAQ